MYDLKRSIDRLKIRLEEHSGIGNDVVSEYENTKERDAFLTKEMVDIETSIKNLESLIVDLKKVLDERFTKGVETINERFGDFFKTMFGGGSAFLSITVEKKRKKKSDTEVLDEEELEEISDAPEGFERGIDVHVNLPDKKVKELSMLSGGERSLVSIALLFAISQVNPPPFLVLDETDAALDEANSRRYGDMVERLSEYSQLIVVTHNRETMSRATVLYGVTLGADSGSKLLSIKFDEAVKVAK
jgi:chromosome segregation protein